MAPARSSPWTRRTPSISPVVQLFAGWRMMSTGEASSTSRRTLKRDAFGCLARFVRIGGLRPSAAVYSSSRLRLVP
jgi:hypothetical protein